MSIASPVAGTWRTHVTNSLSPLGTRQSYTETLEIARVQYRPLLDIGTVNATSRDEIYRTIRSFILLPFGQHFRPSFAVSRADLAATLLYGGRVPQYLPASPSYSDVLDAATMLPVESAQAAPCGALFDDATAGGSFRPDTAADRLTAAIALVRAVGLRAEADARAGTPLAVADASAIPYEYRGYVAVALERGLLVTNSAGYFRPQSALTRADLAHAMVVFMTMVSS